MQTMVRRIGVTRWVMIAAAVVWVALVLAHVAAGAEPASTPPPRPNVVLILIDDMGWADLGCQGSKFYRTPNIDKLAAMGVRFTSAYTNGPNCCPTRAALLSGQQYPNNPVYTVASGARGNAINRKLVPVANEEILPLSHVTIAERLKAAGYATALIGKWHLGIPGSSGPREQGFDLNVAGNHTGAPRSYFSPYHNPQLADGPEGEYLTDRLTSEAVAFIEKHKDAPFFLYLPHYGVHTPIEAPKGIVAHYRNKRPVNGQGNPTYAAMIEAVDNSVGRIVQALEETGVADRTIVIFFTDNGGVGGYGGSNAITSNAPLRGGKGQLYEGGVRVPLIVHYPPLTAASAGTTRDTPVVGVDLYPTLLELTGNAPDASYKLDGVSIAPLLRDPAAKLGREAIYWHFPGYLQRHGGGAGLWRLTPAGSIRAGDYKLIEFFEDDRVELYNLADDLGETRDLASTQPAKAAELRQKLADWRKSVNAPMPQPKQNP